MVTDGRLFRWLVTRNHAAGVWTQPGGGRGRSLICFWGKEIVKETRRFPGTPSLQEKVPLSPSDDRKGKRAWEHVL
jgi:hypothetical protein